MTVVEKHALMFPHVGAYMLDSLLWQFTSSGLKQGPLSGPRCAHCGSVIRRKRDRLTLASCPVEANFCHPNQWLACLAAFIMAAPLSAELAAIFHRGTPTSSSNASSLSFTYLHYFVLFLSVSWISFHHSPFFNLFWLAFLFLFPLLLNLYSHFTSILLNLLVVILSLPLSPASSSFLSLSAPICQAHSPPPTVMYSELLRTGE